VRGFLFFSMNYDEFLDAKRHKPANHGIEPTWLPDGLFDFQQYVCEYGIRKGRCAEFLDTGLGKTVIELTTAVNYHKHTGKPVLILTPLAVAFQFIKEAAKFGIEDIEYSKDGRHTCKIVVCNYERLDKFNAEDFVFTFSNGSQIVFKEIQYLPSDPEYSYLGGYECADAFVDEAQQVPGRGLELLGSRIRLNLIGDREQPKPKILMTCNPSKGYLYNEYYDPYRTNKLRPERIFIPALLSDNTLMKNRDVYEETLKSLSERDYKRLALGDWDYDDSPDLLFDTQSMLQMFTKDVEASGDGYITCDPAAMGNDRTVICLWKGLHLVRFFEYNHKYPMKLLISFECLQRRTGCD